MLAVVRERRLVEGFENDLELLFEQLAVSVWVEHRRIERFDLAGVIAATDPEEHPTASQIVGGSVVLG